MLPSAHNPSNLSSFFCNSKIIKSAEQNIAGINKLISDIRGKQSVVISKVLDGPFGNCSTVSCHVAVSSFVGHSFGGVNCRKNSKLQNMLIELFPVVVVFNQDEHFQSKFLHGKNMSKRILIHLPPLSFAQIISCCENPNAVFFF